MAFPNSQQVRFIVKPLWFAACAAPFAWLLLAVFEIGGQSLGADPIEAIQDHLGIWGLRLLLLTLALTPLRKLTGRSWWIRLRRMTGLFTLFYIGLHFLNYLVLDQNFDWPLIIEDIIERPFITIGFIALLAMIPLGVTSTAGWMRRLGKRWQKLHRLVYAIAILGCWHFWWQVKADILEPLIYATILAILFGFRIWHARFRQPAPVRPFSA
jgi:sulfoxide reductase heme-binding subunit YedZ